MQLDIFNDSRDVMLRNDVLQALQSQDADKASLALLTFQREYPEDDTITPLQMLLTALATRQQAAVPPPQLVHHTALRLERLNLLEVVTPAAHGLMGPATAKPWLRPFWQDLISRAASLPFRPEFEADHVAPMWLALLDWSGAAQAVAQIASWRRIPAPLAWMAQARLHDLGLDATWPLLAELAWLSPKRLDALVQQSNHVVLQRLKDQFDACFEPDPDSNDATEDVAWFPAWVLTQRPQEVAHLSQAQPGQHSAPEQAMRVLVNLLGLERQGRHHDIVAQRKSLRGLNAWLYAQYMQTR